MEQVTKFSIQNLLERKKDGNISGPMSPLLFAQEMAKQEDFKLIALPVYGLMMNECIKSGRITDLQGMIH